MEGWKNLERGLVMPTEPGGYCDQPSVVVAADGSWVGTVTTSTGAEGSTQQYVSVMRSFDRGVSWTSPVRLEDPEDGRYWESAYSKLYISPEGRIFCFYCYNADHVDIRGGPVYRYDMGGHFCFRYSDDCGAAWSGRLTVPIRDFEIDRFEPLHWRGHELRLFWNVSRPYLSGGALYVPLSKVSNKNGFMRYTEGLLLRSPNVLDDPERAVWETLPEGDAGVRGVEGGGTVAEELSFVTLGDGTIQATFRTVDGCAGTALSRDRGRSFAKSKYLTYPDGRPVKNSRAANFLWELGNGRYLYWFENCGFKGFYTRNPAWVCAAVETDTPEGKELRLSQPEILLYHESSSVGFSYPDLIMDSGRYFVTETQKSVARIHEIPAEFIELLFSQFEINEVARRNLLCDTAGHTAVMPRIEPFIRHTMETESCQTTTGAGYTLEFWLDFKGRQRLFGNLSTDGQGLAVKARGDGSVAVLIRDLRECSLIDTRADLLQTGLCHLCVIIDGASRIVRFVMNGQLEDGGPDRAFGWGLLSRSIAGIGGGTTASLGRCVRRFRMYGRALSTTECIGNYRAGITADPRL